jgi:hypothetical protein
MKTKYFSGMVELSGAVYPVKRAIVRAEFPVGTIKKFDDFNLLVGTVSGKYDTTNFLPVTRIIRHDENGSGHKCDSRCRCAKGGDCECSCGGEFHGIDRA